MLVSKIEHSRFTVFGGLDDLSITEFRVGPIATSVLGSGLTGVDMIDNVIEDIVVVCGVFGFAYERLIGFVGVGSSWLGSPGLSEVGGCRGCCIFLVRLGVWICGRQMGFSVSLEGYGSLAGSRRGMGEAGFGHDDFQ
ncbi:unnamed protein product [Lupinus luteus]|uniref:Uncharacterized protein n=1 Tax=Lupinus luteus TaxID=3873 RepID=A0AAV1XJF0_LUPLU